MFRLIPRITPVFLLVVAGTLAPVAAAEERQLVGSGEGSVSGGLYGRGEVTHLGRSTLSLDGYTDFLASGAIFFFGGSLESASHDFLHFAFDEEAYYFDTATGVVSATVTFTGGTGRFQDVTGSADVLIVFDPSHLSYGSYTPFLFVVDGSIDY